MKVISSSDAEEDEMNKQQAEEEATRAVGPSQNLVIWISWLLVSEEFKGSSRLFTSLTV